MKLNEFTIVDTNIDIDKYLYFYNSIIDELFDKTWLGKFDKEKIKDILAEGGKIWIWQNKEKEIVCSIMGINSTQKALEKLGLANMKSSEVYECGAVLVNKKYRGNGLQLQMLDVIENYTKDLQKPYLLTTIHPDNVYSVNNFVKAKYNYIKTISLSRGERAVYIKDIL